MCPRGDTNANFGPRDASQANSDKRKSLFPSGLGLVRPGATRSAGARVNFIHLGRGAVLQPDRRIQPCARANETVPLTDDDLPPPPKPDKHGRFPAEKYACVSLARDVIRSRCEAGLTQQQLADLAGTRQETISRIESGNYKPAVRTVAKIERALSAAHKARQKAKGR